MVTLIESIISNIEILEIQMQYGKWESVKKFENAQHEDTEKLLESFTFNWIRLRVTHAIEIN